MSSGIPEALLDLVIVTNKKGEQVDLGPVAEYIEALEAVYREEYTDTVSVTVEAALGAARRALGVED